MGLRACHRSLAVAGGRTQTLVFLRLTGSGWDATDAVLTALGRALRLDEDEQAHLRSLARPPRAAVRRPRQERVRPATMTILECMGDTPAMVLGVRADILA
ncbi:hypothetical protein AB0K18_30185 [Nonomuraea sp. NPDC049421]|uniref:hypothetical protein n=1 Tax=Nonomuraea sp. NPDC049421 TaxID=3155275 RepID=UPI003449C1D3